MLASAANIFRTILSRAVGRDRLINACLNEAAMLVGPEDRYLVPIMEKGEGPEKDRFSYQKEYVDFKIREGEKVLDIGFGAYPFPYATHLADLYENETTHRVEPIARDGRPFDLCDIERLPYKDTEFDFVYCSHVLEHVLDPARACEELMRVGRRGYIETPTRTSDIMLNFTRLAGHHRWYISIAGSTLFFFEWPDVERRDTGCNDFFKMLHSIYKNPFQNLVRANRNIFTNMMLWEGRFYYFVFDKNGDLIATNKVYVGG